MAVRGKVVVAVTVAILALLTAPVLAAPPEPQLGLPVTLEGDGLMPCYVGCGGVYGVPSSNLDYEQTVVEMVNAIRAEQVPPLPPLKRAAALDDAARYHSTDMAVDDYFSHSSHDRVDGSLVLVCDAGARLTTYYTNWNSLSENIAAGYSSPEAVMAAWMVSDGHRANILRSTSWEIGVGYYQGEGTYGRYWTQDFGRRRDVFPVVINREAVTTDDYLVALYVYGVETWSEMRLRNNDAAWSEWRTFQSELTWELPKQVGEHTVWVELRNGSQTTISSDRITSTWAPPAPTLSQVPESVSFVYDGVTGSLIPPSRVIALSNTTTDDPITWSLTSEGDWFTATPTAGTTPSTFTVVPTTFATDAGAMYTGMITVTATYPLETVSAVQRIALTLDVQLPALGGLPDVVTLTYSLPSQQLLPSFWTLTPRNVGSDHLLSWRVVTDAPWAEVVPQVGTTPQGFTVTATGFPTASPALYTGALTVTVESPTGISGSPHRVRLALNVVDRELSRAFLPLVFRNH
jgi:uncharacterized protein YkwD